MIDEATRSFIKSEIAKQVNVILSGQAGNNTQFAEDASNIYPGMPTLPQRPVMHPYGYVSRAPAGTFQVTGRMGDHSGNRIVMGHRDSNRPSLNQGEVMIYNEFGQQIYIADGKIMLGVSTATHPVLLGDTVQTLLENILNAIISHTHEGNLGYPTGTPLNASTFQQYLSNPVQNGLINSQVVFTE